MDEEHQDNIEYYINKLQSLLSRVIAESDEFKELKKLVNTDQGDLQLCIFSVLLDKKNADSLKQLDPEILQKWLLDDEGQALPLDAGWSDSDKEFLKKIRITF